MSTDNDSENSAQEEFSIGELLRTEREKKGISKSRLAEIIKVRENVIDALENEEWDKLPARVFIKGFIRSYTISIGYDTTTALRLFDKSFPSRGEETPVPLIGRRKKSRAKYYYVVLILIIILIAVYLFTLRDKADNGIKPDQTVSETSSNSEESVSDQVSTAETVIPEEVKDTAVTETKSQESIPPEPEKTFRIQEELKKSSGETPEESEIENTYAEESQSTLPEEVSGETYREEENMPVEEAGETVYNEETPAPETVAGEPPEALLTLTATVNMRTYVRVIIDDNEPKEYIFQPGSHPDWKAVRGFEVKVGNAAGIEFEFNGEKIENIGDMGKVKTLRFPKDFKTNREEE